jgi:hypothetical protein
MTLHFTCENRRDDQTYLRVSTRALDRAHAATDPVLHQSVSEGKVAGETLKAPIVGAYEGPQGSDRRGL